MIINHEGSKAMVAAWGYLNKYIITGHENGEISQYDWKVSRKQVLLKKKSNIFS
jgi:translation initiation factor 3 subunit I